MRTAFAVVCLALLCTGETRRVQHREVAVTNLEYSASIASQQSQGGGV